MLSYTLLFRAIFDLSNKIALLILLWMYALYVKKRQKLKMCLKVKIVQTQLHSAQLDSTQLSLTQLNSAQLSSTQLNSLNLTWLN